MAASDTPSGLTPTPLYREVQWRITRALAAGEWKPGEAIPSEAELAADCGVSIGTIRRAVDELVAGRILVRQQGRGTFVATHTEDRTLFYFFHIAGKDGSREFPESELLGFRKERSNDGDEHDFGLARGTRVARVRNLLKLGSRPVVLDDITVPTERFARLDESTFRSREGTIYALYQARYGVNVVRIGERLSAAHPPADVAAILGMRTNQPALHIRRIAYSYNDSPVEYRHSWINTADHEYLSDLWKTAAL
ncbi:MAG: GntR family transcriptional regulator [Burkholderiales bacterium]|nr:GntR family transcriptional regulator [Burkholderiales bacterium]